MTNFELGQCKGLTQTCPWTIHKGQEVTMTLDLLSLILYPTFFQPPLRLELFRIGSPEARGAVHSTNRNRDCLARGDGDTVNGLIVSRLDGNT